ncbi:MAG: maleylpyruvate isomerase family mycothiol-dependent enzyme, partial [Dehalococcoidia bacterium]
ARNLPKLAHAEAVQLATDELERFLALLESLSSEDWQQPTVCTLWNVSQMVAHLAGTAAGYTSWAQFKRQFITNPYASRTALKVDAISMCQVEDRAGATPAALLDELRELGPRAIRTRQRLPWLLRNLCVPLGPPLGIAPIGYLTDLIYTRDMWMHRLDICRATGRGMSLTADHDGRIVELVMRDLGKKLHRRLGKRNIRVELTGPAGGIFDFGSGSGPSATLQMDTLDFNWLAAGRTSPEDIRSEVLARGDTDQAEWFLANTNVPF